jgi:hypothetical protein
MGRSNAAPLRFLGGDLARVDEIVMWVTVEILRFAQDDIGFGMTSLLVSGARGVVAAENSRQDALRIASAFLRVNRRYGERRRD